jgi:type II secretory pathway component PulK
MRINNRVLGNQAGVALITTVILLLMLASLGAALIGLVQTRLNAVVLEVDRLQAVYLAEAGLARASYEQSKDRDVFGNDGIGVIPITPFGSGHFWVTQHPESRVLRGIGLVHDVRRVIINRY